jgi:hypothetical protein
MQVWLMSRVTEFLEVEFRIQPERLLKPAAISVEKQGRDNHDFKKKRQSESCTRSAS